MVWKIGQQPGRQRYCRQMREIEVDRGGRVLRARDAGDPSGPAVMYFEHLSEILGVLSRPGAAPG